MMKLLERPGTYTYDDYRTIIPGGTKADLIDGVIYEAPPENTEANDLFLWLAAILYDFCEYHDVGKVFGSRVSFRLDDKTGPEPDIAVVLAAHLDRVKRTHVAGPADLALEIVSRESVERDYH